MQPGKPSRLGAPGRPRGASDVDVSRRAGCRGPGRVRTAVDAEPGSGAPAAPTVQVVPAESLAEVFHLYSEGGARLLRPHEVPIVRASRGEVVEDAIVTVRAPGQPVRHLRVNATPMVGLTVSGRARGP